MTRSFCYKCGTPVAYFNEKWGHETHFYIAALDNPSSVRPQFHVHWAERVDWINIDDDLPKYTGSADD